MQNYMRNIGCRRQGAVSNLVVPWGIPRRWAWGTVAAVAASVALHRGNPGDKPQWLCTLTTQVTFSASFYACSCKDLETPTQGPGEQFPACGLIRALPGPWFLLQVFDCPEDRQRGSPGTHESGSCSQRTRRMVTRTASIDSSDSSGAHSYQRCERALNNLKQNLTISYQVPGWLPGGYQTATRYQLVRPLQHTWTYQT